MELRGKKRIQEWRRIKKHTIARRYCNNEHLLVGVVAVVRNRVYLWGMNVSLRSWVLGRRWGWKTVCYGTLSQANCLSSCLYLFYLWDSQWRRDIFKGKEEGDFSKTWEKVKKIGGTSENAKKTLLQKKALFRAPKNRYQSTFWLWFISKHFMTHKK